MTCYFTNLFCLHSSLSALLMGETGESRCRFLPISTRRIIVHVVGARDVINLKVSGEVPVGKRYNQQTQGKIP